MSHLDLSDTIAVLLIAGLVSGDHDFKRIAEETKRAWYDDERLAAEWIDVGGEG